MCWRSHYVAVKGDVVLFICVSKLKMLPAYIIPVPPGLFPYPRPPGGGGRIRSPCYLENQWSNRVPRGGVRKLSTRSPQSILKILRLTLNPGSKLGQRSNLNVSVWWSLGPVISIAFARNSSKVTSKGYWRHPVSVSVIVSKGQGQGQVTKGYERSRESKIHFRSCSTLFIFTFTRRTIKSKPFCNLTPCKSTTEKDQVNPGAHNVKFSNSYFRIKN